jgi:homoserine O-acetyltransferase
MIMHNALLARFLGVLLMCAAVTAQAINPADFPNYREGKWSLSDFKFNSGESLANLTLGYTTLGTPQRDSKGEIVNAVLLLHGTTGTANSWLQPSLAKALYGPGQALDAQRYYLIIPDGIGLGRSSKPSDGLKANFPHYGYLDMVEANYRLAIEGLEVHRFRAIVGTSMGGMQTWLFAERHPDFMEGAIAIASLPMPVSGRNMMWREMLIESIRTAPDWNGGNYTHAPEQFQRVWPIFGIMTDGATHLQSVAPIREAAIEHYRTLANQARALDANDILYRFEASADYNPGPDLEKIQVPFLAINFQDDGLNPVELGVLDREMKRVKQGRFHNLSGGKVSFGHQGLAQGALWGPIAADFLKSLPAGHP